MKKRDFLFLSEIQDRIKAFKEEIFQSYVFKEFAIEKAKEFIQKERDKIKYPFGEDSIKLAVMLTNERNKRWDENKIKDVDGCIVLRKIDLLQRAQKYSQIFLFRYIFSFQ